MAKVTIDPHKRFEMTMPAVVIGAGACGLVAGISAASHGAETLVNEKDPTPFGSFAMSLGLMCV